MRALGKFLCIAYAGKVEENAQAELRKVSMMKYVDGKVVHDMVDGYFCRFHDALDLFDPEMPYSLHLVVFMYNGIPENIQNQLQIQSYRLPPMQPASNLVQEDELAALCEALITAEDSIGQIAFIAEASVHGGGGPSSFATIQEDQDIQDD